MTDWSPTNSHQVSYSVVKLTDDNMLSNAIAHLSCMTITWLTWSRDWCHVSVRVCSHFDRTSRWFEINRVRRVLL